MKKSVLKLLTMAITMSLLFAPLAMAGSSSLTKWDSSTGKFDLVISLAWSPTSGDKTKLETVFKLYAEDVYRMTEGKHSLNNLYVYTPDAITGKPRMWSKADIRFKNKMDAANANINGLFLSGGRIYVDDDLSDLDEVGHALAHEMGHYAYGLYDEYKANQNMETVDGFPHSNDTPKSTLMASHWAQQQFSLASDYSDKGKRKTAQWRMYESSAWDTLTRDPLLDFLYNADLFAARDRYEFTDLVNMTTPTSLSEPTSNPSVNIIWMEGSEGIIIIDNSGSMGTDNKMENAKSGAKSFVDKIKDGEYAALVSFNSSTSTLQSLQQLDSTTKASFKASIDSISDGGGTAIGDALRSGLNLLNGSTRQGTFKYIVLMTDGQSGSGESPTGSILTYLAAAGYPVYSIGFGSGADMSTLNTISNSTRGKAYSAASSASLNAIYSDIQSVVSDDQLVGWVKENLNLSKPSTSTTVVIDSSAARAIFSAAFPSGDTMEMTLKNPSGTTITASNVSNYSDIEYTSEEGYIIFTVTDPDAGDWEVTLTGTNFASSSSDSEVVLEAKSDSDYTLGINISDVTYPEPLIITATPSKDYGIKGLAVSGMITNPSGKTSLLTLSDDGISPDEFADDGIYSGIITNYEEGEYSINVTVSNASGKAVETPAGFLKNGSFKEGSVPSESALAEDFSLSGNATATTYSVTSDDHGSSFSGATVLKTDGTTVSGSIETDKDVDYFYFSATKGDSYTIFTSGLYPAGSMETLMTLFDEDMSTELTHDSDGNQGVGAMILWTAPATDYYYLTVEHGNNSTGLYSIGVRPAQDYDAISDGSVKGEDESDEESCFIATAAYVDGGGSIVSVLPYMAIIFLGLALVLITIRRKKSKKLNLAKERIRK